MEEEMRCLVIGFLHGENNLLDIFDYIDARAISYSERIYLFSVCNDTLNSVIESDDKIKLDLAAMSYAEYLDTHEWFLRRNIVKRAYNYKCQLCNKHSTSLNVHHNNYANTKREHFVDLVLLCGRCHARHHGHLAKESSKPLPVSTAGGELPTSDGWINAVLKQRDQELTALISEIDPAENAAVFAYAVNELSQNGQGDEWVRVAIDKLETAMVRYGSNDFQETMKHLMDAHRQATTVAQSAYRQAKGR